MRLRASLIASLSLILIVVSGSGVHQHWEHHHHDHSSAFQDVDHHDNVVGLAEESADHVLAHLRGDLDVGGIAKAVGSAVGWQLAVFIVSVLLAAIVLLPAPLRLRVRRIIWRPPDWLRRSYLTPPSQAPPVPA